MWAWMTGRNTTPPPTRPALVDGPLMEPVYPAGSPTTRTSIEASPYHVQYGLAEAMAYGRPSTGGILMRKVNLVDLQELGVSRLAGNIPVPESISAEEEDAWCAKLRRLGAGWQRSYADFIMTERGRTRVELRCLYVAWPTSGEGVWVFSVDRRGLLPRDFGRYNMCLNMDERCELLKHYGARFFANPDDCEELTPAYSERFRRERDKLEDETGR